jgi:hypothetical protein
MTISHVRNVFWINPTSKYSIFRWNTIAPVLPFYMKKTQHDSTQLISSIAPGFTFLPAKNITWLRPTIAIAIAQ